MLFKKKISPAIAEPNKNAAKVQTQSGASSNGSSNGTSNGTPKAKPTYQKPVLRRYDQIDQVKPYGPSEV